MHLKCRTFGYRVVIVVVVVGMHYVEVKWAGFNLKVFLLWMTEVKLN